MIISNFCLYIPALIWRQEEKNEHISCLAVAVAKIIGGSGDKHVKFYIEITKLHGLTFGNCHISWQLTCRRKTEYAAAATV